MKPTNYKEIKRILNNSQFKDENKKEITQIIDHLIEYVAKENTTNTISFKYFIKIHKLTDFTFLNNSSQEFLIIYSIFLKKVIELRDSKPEEDIYDTYLECFSLFYIYFSKTVNNFLIEQRRINSSFYSYPAEAAEFLANNDTRPLKKTGCFGVL